LSVVTPVFRNAETIVELHRRLTTVCSAYEPYEIIFVNDSGPDHSLQVLKEITELDSHAGVVALRENGGQNRAVIAGVANASGDAIVIMDADLQDPPEAIPALLDKLQNGYDVVFGGRRGSYEPAGRMVTSRLFKRVLSLLSGFRLPSDAGLFLVMNHGAALRALDLADDDPHVVGLLARTGARMTSVGVTRSARANGQSAYSGSARLKVATNAFGSMLRRRAPGRSNIGEHELIGSPFEQESREQNKSGGSNGSSA
jgi:glycosyltransferase involved in cell wall biosynthesis